MTSKIIVNTIEADTGISSVTFASNINLQNDSSVLVSSSGVTLGTGSTIAAPSANEITLSTNSAERLRVDSAGRMLLGTTIEGESNADTLTIAESGNAGITIRSGSSATGSIYFSDATSGGGEYDGWIAYNQNSRYFQFGTAQTEKVRLTSGGNLGIKNTSPNNTLTVGDTVQPSYAPSFAGNYIEIARTSGGDAGLLINKNTGQWLVGIDNSDGANAPLRFEYGAAGSAHPGFGAGTLGMFMKHNGNIGIGTDNPTKALHLAQNSDIAIRMDSNNANANARTWEIIVGGNASNNAEMVFRTRQDDGTGGSECARIKRNGIIALPSGGGIDFSANSNASGMTSEVLDDYEEGAFDPRLRFGTSTEIGTFNTQSKAEYVKVGKIVHVSGWARYDSVNTSNSGILHMDLPFTVDEYGMPHNYVYPGSVVLTHTDLQQKGIHIWCGNAGAARTRFGFYNSTSGSTDYIENGDLGGWNGNTRNLHFNFSYQTND